MKLENRLKEVRLQNNFTQEDLAEAVNVTRQTIIAIEKGKFGPTVSLALALAFKLGVKVEDLFWLEPDHRKNGD
jgi:putative transcriptional regulator